MGREGGLLAGGVMIPDGEAAQPPGRLTFEPLRQAHAFELADALTDPRVYEFIADAYAPTLQALIAQFAGFAAGPPEHKQHERWWDYVVRVGAGGRAVGRLEATLVDDWAEIAYVFGPASWGQGYATEAVTWLHGRLQQDGAAAAWWASVCPGNVRSARLLTRLGYARVGSGWPALTSHEPGDWVFRRPAGPA